MEEIKIGIVTHYFNKISVAAIKLTDGDLKVGEKIHIKGHKTDFSQIVDSIQIEHQKVEEAKKDDEIGVKVESIVKEGDIVYKVIE